VSPKKVLSCWPQASIPTRALCSLLLYLQNRASAEVARTGIIVQNERIIIWPADVVSAIEMVIGSEREGYSIFEAVRPMQTD
jgi:hypothetical protein